jgi:hypothetical protein
MRSTRARAECDDPSNVVRQKFETAVAGGRVTFHLDAIRACAGGFACVQGSCIARQQAGADCTVDDECIGTCLNSVCTTPGPSCVSSKDAFPVVVIFGVLVPLRRLRQRRR